MAGWPKPPFMPLRMPPKPLRMPPCMPPKPPRMPPKPPICPPPKPPIWPPPKPPIWPPPKPPPPWKADALKVEPAVTTATAANAIAIFRIMMFTPLVAMCTPAFAKLESRRRVGARSTSARCRGSGIRTPKIEVVGKFLQRRIVAGRLKQRERDSHEHVDDGRCMPDIEIDRLEAMSQMQLRIIVQASALKPPASVRHGPSNQIAENVMIKM